MTANVSTPKTLSFPSRLAAAMLIATGAVLTRKLLPTEWVAFQEIVGFFAVAAASLLGPIPATVTALAALIAGRVLLHDSVTRMAIEAMESSALIAIASLLTIARRRAESGAAAASAMERQMLDIADTERRQIGHDLHDSLGQQLTGVALLSKSLEHQLSNREPSVASQAERISTLIGESISWTRTLARGLSPLTLESDGLVAALEELCNSAGKLFSIRCTWHCSATEIALEDTRAMHVYRIVQEAISNSVKHGKARRVDVTATLETAGLVVEVVDDGIGISAKTLTKPGIGLRIMHYRSRLVGAEMSVLRVGVDGGTRVKLAFSP